MRLLLKILLPLVALSVLILAAYLMVKGRKAPDKRPRQAQTTLVDVHVASPSNYQVTLATRGNVQARVESSLLPQVSGRIIKLSSHFRDGGFFTAGDELVAIDPRDFQNAEQKAAAELARAEQQLLEQKVLAKRAAADVTVAQSELAQAQLALTQEEAQARQAQSDWQRLAQAGKPSDLVLRKPQLAAAQASVAASEARLIQRKLDQQLAQTRIAAQEAMVASRRADLAQRRLDQSRTTIRAPYDGRVLKRHVDIDQHVTPATALATIFAIDYVEIRLPLSQEQLPHIDLPEQRRDGSAGKSPEVRLTIPQTDDTWHWDAKIVRTEGAIDTRTRQLFVIAQVNDPYAPSAAGRPPLKVGQFVRAKIKGRKLKDVYVLPRQAVREGNHVLIVDASMKLRRQNITPIHAAADVVVVREGLKSGDRVVTTALSVAPEGMTVRLADDEPSTAQKPGATRP